jgi:hypothetical protein
VAAATAELTARTASPRHVRQDHGRPPTLASIPEARYRRTGYVQARLQVDSSSNTDAVSLYTELGFADSGRGYAILHAPLR